MKFEVNFWFQAILTIIFISLEEKRAWRAHGRIVRHRLCIWSAWILHSNFRRKTKLKLGDLVMRISFRRKLATLGFNWFEFHGFMEQPKHFQG